MSEKDPMELAREFMTRFDETDWGEDDLAALLTTYGDTVREECAQCADRVALPRDKKNMLTGTDINAGMTIAASVIAQAIRARKP